jgi:hypothetical protein
VFEICCNAFDWGLWLTKIRKPATLLWAKKKWSRRVSSNTILEIDFTKLQVSKGADLFQKKRKKRGLVGEGESHTISFLFQTSQMNYLLPFSQTLFRTESLLMQSIWPRRMPGTCDASFCLLCAS